jgi:hypothetical protein
VVLVHSVKSRGPAAFRAGVSAGRSIVLLLILICIIPHRALAAEDLPDRLSSAEFWQLVVDLSEPNGRFQYENFVSNEYNLQSVIPSITSDNQPVSAYIGVGPEQNFTYISALKPKIAFIIDIRRQNLLEHLMYKAVFELSHDRAEFLSLLFSRKRPSEFATGSTAGELFKPFHDTKGERAAFEQNLGKIIERLTVTDKMPLDDEDRANIRYVYSKFFEHGSALDYTVGGFYGFDNPPTYEDLMTADDGQGAMRSFLATEENFETVKELEDNNLIIPVVGDFAGPKAVRSVGRYIAAHQARVTVFYLSNVERYLFTTPGVWRRFYVNVAVLPYDNKSLFIRSIFDTSYGSVSKISTIDDVMNAFSASRITSYGDVIALSH